MVWGGGVGGLGGGGEDVGEGKRNRLHVILIAKLVFG